MRVRAVHEAWVSWMAPHPWQLYWTFTSDRRTHPEAVEKRWRFVCSQINVHLFGNHWQRRGEGVRWLLGIERHKSWNPHCHGLLYAGGFDLTDRDVFSYGKWKRFADNTGGFTWLEPVRASNDVVTYVTKYVLKDGDMFLSEGFANEFQSSFFTAPRPAQAAAAARRPRSVESSGSQQVAALRQQNTTPERRRELEQCRSRGAAELARRKQMENA